MRTQLTTAVLLIQIILAASPALAVQTPLTGSPRGQSPDASGSSATSTDAPEPASEVSGTLDAVAKSVTDIFRPGVEDGTVDDPKWNSLRSPRHALFTFREAMTRIEEGHEEVWPRALRTLQTTASEDADQHGAARALKAVLDRLETAPIDVPGEESVAELNIRRYVFFPRGRDHTWVWDKLGGAPDGEIALVRRDDGSWVFSAATVAGAPALYESMKKLPPQFEATQDPAFFSIFGSTFERTRWWQWLVLLGAIFAGLVVGKIAKIVLKKAADRCDDRNREVAATVLCDLAGPLGLFIFTMALASGLAFIHFEEALSDFRWSVIQLLLLIAAGWLLFNLIDLVSLALRKLTSTTDSKLDDMAVPLVTKSLRIFLVIILAIIALQNVFGMNITGFLAGLGIAGLALSLAAQDSVKNLFGSLTVFFDRPFVIGDFVRFNDSLGTVEQIGFRSTRIRLLSGHLVTEPNMKFIDTKVENITARPFIRREMDITVTYDTPPAKVEQAVEILRDILEDDEVVSAGRFDLDSNPPFVAFNAFNDMSLNIKAFYWYRLEGDPKRGWYTYLEHCELVNGKLLKAYEEAQIEFAFPTQTLYLAGDPNRELAVRGIDGGGSDREQSQGHGD